MLIAFEGIDAAGKSTVIEMVRAHFADWNPELPVIVTSDFSVLPAAKMIKVPMVDEQAPLAQYFLIMAARVITCRSLFPQTEPGLILYDRYVGSTLAYQGSMGLRMDRIAMDHTDAALPDPDMTIILDIPVHVARARKPVPSDAIETKTDGFFNRVRGAYAMIANMHDLNLSTGTTVMLDATKPVEEVACTCISMIKARMAELEDANASQEIHAV